MKIYIFALISLLLLSGCSTAEPVSDSPYKMDTSWAMEDPYAFAVEIDSYEGDILQAGTYDFFPSSDTNPPVYDIYISTNYYDDMDSLQESELSCTVGGVTAETCQINLEKDQYVYVVPIDMIVDTTGYLQVQKQD